MDLYNSGGTTPLNSDFENVFTIEKSYLLQNYPNPFNPETTIEYSISREEGMEKGEVRLIICDVLGREVATLVDEPQPQGNYRVQFYSSKLTSGVYFYILKYGELIQSRKMLLIK